MNRRTWLPWAVPFVVIPPVLGLFSGWLVGSSQSPVVTAFLPLLFGAAGAVVYGFVDGQVKSEKRSDRLLAIPEIKSLPEGAREQISAVMEVPIEGVNWLPVYWTVAIVTFIGFCYWGVQLGGQARIPQYSTEALLEEGITIIPAEMALLHRGRMLLQIQGVTKDDARKLFKTSLLGILNPQAPEYESKASQRYYQLKAAVEALDTRLRAPTPTF